MKDTAAFTLLELLIVMAILGILMAVGFAGYSRWLAANKVLQGAQEFGQMITAARAGAKRQNACWQVKIFSSGGGPTTQYTLSKYSSSACTGTPVTSTYSLPSGTQIQLVAGTNDLSFLPPYGTTDVTVTRFNVNWISNTDWQREVYVTGVMAKVIIK